MYAGLDINPQPPPNKHIARASNMYRKHSPLSVYTYIATTEAVNYSSNGDFWKSLCAPIEPVSCYYITYGLIEDNTLFSFGDTSRNDEMSDVENRTPRPYHNGFLDSYYTP